MKKLSLAMVVLMMLPFLNASFFCYRKMKGHISWLFAKPISYRGGRLFRFAEIYERT